MLVTGDRGVGKTTICRTLADQLRRRMPVAYVAPPLLSPTDLLRLVLKDFSAASTHPPHLAASDKRVGELHDLFVQFVSGLKPMRNGAVLIVDEAHHLPAVLMDPGFAASTICKTRAPRR